MRRADRGVTDYLRHTTPREPRVVLPAPETLYLLGQSMGGVEHEGRGSNWVVVTSEGELVGMAGATGEDY